MDEAKPFHWQRPNIGSRVTREGHARFWERPEVKFLRSTRQRRRVLGSQRPLIPCLEARSRMTTSLPTGEVVPQADRFERSPPPLADALILDSRSYRWRLWWADRILPREYHTSTRRLCYRPHQPGNFDADRNRGEVQYPNELAEWSGRCPLRSRVRIRSAEWRRADHWFYLAYPTIAGGRPSVTSVAT